MRHYCTLFDSRYAPQGIALYDSLALHSSEPFTLHILALDVETWEMLNQLRLPNVATIPIESFVHETGLSEIRKTRTHQEWCWGLASQLSEWLICGGLLEVTYCDADCWFMADPELVFKEIAHRSIAITPHQFPDNSEKPRLSQSGRFNVGLIHFKSTPAGRKCLQTWAAQVRMRCSAEVGCGDQCYLDSWCDDYGYEVCVLGTGINMGPWNLMAYEVTKREGAIYLGGYRLVCFHYHEYRHGERLTNYPLRQIDRDLVYQPYVEACTASLSRITALNVCDRGVHIGPNMECQSA